MFKFTQIYMLTSEEILLLMYGVFIKIKPILNLTNNSFLFSSIYLPEISSKSAVLSLGFFMAIFSTAPWKTRKFLALTLIPNCSRSFKQAEELTTSPLIRCSAEDPVKKYRKITNKHKIFGTKKKRLGQLKFGLSEKHTKFEKIYLMVLKNQLIYLVNVKTIRKIFSNYVCFSKSPNFTYRNVRNVLSL